jgi:outer membrane lipoprotein-sorting protein
MRKISWLALVIIWPLAVGRADDQADARAIIDKAIKAEGGEATIARFKAQTWNEKGTYYGMGDGLPFTGKYAVQFPGQFRMEIESVFTVVLDGDKGWVASMGETKEMDKEQLANQKQMQYVGQVTRLITLKDKGFKLSPLPEIKIDKQPAVGVKVSRQGQVDVLLYFDKATGLLTKSEQTVKSQEQKGKEVKQEMFMSDYKDFGGLKVPTKMVAKRDGKLYIEATLSDIKPVEKLEDKVFAKP